MKHDIKLKNYEGSLEQLAIDIGNLRYDALHFLLVNLSLKLQSDGVADLSRERPCLALELTKASEVLDDVADHIENAWVISEPYMRIKR